MFAKVTPDGNIHKLSIDNHFYILIIIQDWCAMSFVSFEYDDRER